MIMNLRLQPGGHVNFAVMLLLGTRTCVILVCKKLAVLSLSPAIKREKKKKKELVGLFCTGIRC